MWLYIHAYMFVPAKERWLQEKRTVFSTGINCCFHQWCSGVSWYLLFIVTNSQGVPVISSIAAERKKKKNFFGKIVLTF